jgi:hypothetical protein
MTAGAKEIHHGATEGTERKNTAKGQAFAEVWRQR